MDSLRFGALVFLGLLTATYLAVLFHVTSIVAGTTRLALVVAGAFMTGVWVANSLDPRGAAGLAGGILVAGMTVYSWLTPGVLAVASDVPGFGRDVLALLSGHTVLAIMAVDIWVMAVAPGPVFLSWYLGVRERYAEAAGVGLVTLIFFIFTSDAGTLHAVAGVIGAAGTVGFGELARRDASVADSDLVVIVLAAMLVASLALSVVPAGMAQPITPGAYEEEPVSTEVSLLGGDELTVSGQPTLDPTVRFTITAEERQNWRVDAYDRYTGAGWIQTGDRDRFDNEPVLGSSEQVEMTARAEVDDLSTMPAHWRAIDVSGVDDTLSSPADGLYSADGLAAGDTYTVTSERPDATVDELRRAGTDYPAHIEDRYTQLPESTPDRVGELTTELVAHADSPYEAAEIIEQYIIETNEYSLDVDAPDGDIADAQLFERDAGYCTFFATTMVAMLRTQDIPARLVTGYSAGERVAEDRWVVRGMNAHAWVEMYIPEYGWVEFDPTPSGPYDAWRADVLEEARADELENVDTNESGGEPWTPDIDDEHESAPEVNESGPLGDVPDASSEICHDPTAVNRGLLSPQEAMAFCSEDQVAAMGVDPAFGVGIHEPGAEYPDMDALIEEFGAGAVDGEGTAEAEEDEPFVPVERVLVALAILVGGVAGARRARLPVRVRYAVGVHWQGRSGDATGATERAWWRVETHLSAKYGSRRTGETVRAYVERLDAAYHLDEGVHDVAEAYERARYAPGEIDPREARRAVRRTDAIVGGPRDRLSRLGR